MFLHGEDWLRTFSGAPRETGCHIVQFYESDAFLVDRLASFVGGALGAGEAAVVIATERHRSQLDLELRNRGLDTGLAAGAERYIALDAAETLGQLMVAGMPDEGRFVEVIGGVIRRAGSGGRPVRAFGEMVALLWADGARQAAVRLEQLWNELAATEPFSLLCAYPLTHFPTAADREALRTICGEHSLMIPAESYTGLDSTAERLRAVTELQQQAQALGPALFELASIVAESDDAIIGKNLDGIVTSWNGGAERMFGYTAQEMVGQPISRLYPFDRASELGTILGAIRRGERVSHYETERVCKDGRRIHVSLSISPIKDTHGRVIGASKIARDITARKRAEAERDELLQAAQLAREEAEAANRAKDEFLAMLGHELRNPLAALRNAVLSASSHDGTHTRRALAIADRQSKRLVRLVDDLLDVARISKGTIAVHKEPLPLATIVHRALDEAQVLAQERGQLVLLSVPDDRIVVDADATRLEQVFANLLNNAVKFSPAGKSITVHCELRDGQATVRVRDSGVGLSPDMIGRVFDLFVQAPQSLDRSHGGLGIGLTVVKRLVELHGGSVEAHSAGIGKGAEFVVRLPARLAAETPSAAAAPSASGASPAEASESRVRILLVEDTPDTAESLRMLLQLLGHQVRVAGDATTALQMARANVPDVMLVDIGLPDIDGYELARRIRDDPRIGKVVLVALTGYGRAEDRERAILAGFDHHLVKPIDPDTLEGLVAKFARAAEPGGGDVTVH